MGTVEFVVTMSGGAPLFGATCGWRGTKTESAQVTIPDAGNREGSPVVIVALPDVSTVYVAWAIESVSCSTRRTMSEICGIQLVRRYVVVVRSASSWVEWSKY